MCCIPNMAAMEVKYDGEEYLIMRQNDILAIIKD